MRLQRGADPTRARLQRGFDSDDDFDLSDSDFDFEANLARQRAARYSPRYPMATSDTRIQSLWNRLAAVRGAGVFSRDDLEGLPAPARRYLLHSIEPDTPLAGSVRLAMHGEMRLARDGARLPMAAEQVIAPPHGFVWRAKVGTWWLRIVGHDSYADGEASMAWKLWNVLPVVRAGGADVSRSAAGRMAIESIFLPSSLLPRAGTSWAPVDDATARATIGDGRHTVDFTVRESGQLARATMLRWGNENPARAYREEAFGTFTVGEEKTFSGYTIPTRLSVGWRPGSDDAFEFFFAEIDQATYT